MSRTLGKPLPYSGSQIEHFDHYGDCPEIESITFKYLPTGESLVYEDRSAKPMPGSYRVVSAFVAIKSAEEGHKTITVPAGSQIQICGQVQQSGLVDIELDGEIVAVFMRDIDARAEPLE